MELTPNVKQFFNELWEARRKTQRVREQLEELRNRSYISAISYGGTKRTTKKTISNQERYTSSIIELEEKLVFYDCQELILRIKKEMWLYDHLELNEALALVEQYIKLNNGETTARNIHKSLSMVKRYRAKGLKNLEAILEELKDQ